MKVKCGDTLTVNLEHPVFKSIIISEKSKTIIAIGEGFLFKFYFRRREGDTYYGDFIESVSINDLKNLPKEVWK